MKRNLPILIFFVSFLSACSPKSFNSMMVVRDCTGTYLRKDSIDYPVCNVQLLEGISEGTSVRVSYQLHEKKDKCEAQEGIRCMMVHPFQTGEWIEILKAKKTN